MDDNMQPASAGQGEACLADDILKGAEAISEFTGYSVNQITFLLRTGKIPHFRVGKFYNARKSTLLRWIEEQENQTFTGEHNE